MSVLFCVWPDGTTCLKSELYQFSHKSNDFLICSMPDEDEGAIPSYDEIAAAMKVSMRNFISCKPPRDPVAWLKLASDVTENSKDEVILHREKRAMQARGGISSALAEKFNIALYPSHEDEK